MSHIIQSGNLAGPVTLDARDDGTVRGRVTVIANDRVQRDDGRWEDGTTTAYRLTVTGRAASRLAEFQERNGNRHIIFSGSLRRRTYTTSEGEKRISNDVYVSYIGVSLAVHDLDVREEGPAPVAAPDGPETALEPEANPWTPDPMI